MAEQQQNETPQRATRTVRQLDTLIDQRIRDAMQRGLFSGLSTHGRPLELDLKDAIDHEAWFASRTLKSFGAVPAWMELGKEIDRDERRFAWMALDFRRWLAEVRDELLPLSVRERVQRRPGIELRYDDRLTRFRALADELRAKVDRFNLQVPVRALEKPGIWVAHELDRLQQPYAALCAELDWQSPSESPATLAEPEVALQPAAARSIWRRLLGR